MKTKTKKMTRHQIIMMVLQQEIELKEFVEFSQAVYDANGSVQCIDCEHVREVEEEGYKDEDECKWFWTWYIPQDYAHEMPVVGDRLIVSNLDATAVVCAISDVYLISKKTHLQNGHPYKSVICPDALLGE